AAALSQRVLRAGLRDPLRHDSAARGTHPREKFSAAGAEAVSAAGGRSGDADPGGIFARPQHPASGAGGGAVDRRGGERTDGVEADPRSGPSGTPVSSGAAQRRLCVSVSGRREPAGAATGGAQAGADAGGLRSAARWHPPLAGLSAPPGRKPSRLGRLAAGSVPAWTGRPATGSDHHRRLSRPGGGDGHRLSASAASALLGAQDAEPFAGRAEVGLRRRQGGRPSHLLSRKPRPSSSRLSNLSGAVAWEVWADGATAGTRLAGTAVVLRLFPASVAETAHHQRDRALLRGSATPHSSPGVLCERRKCGSHHLLHFPEIQSGMENPHPLRIYTSSLTSPFGEVVAPSRFFSQSGTLNIVRENGPDGIRTRTCDHDGVLCCHYT